jgi:dephospho-CoA kinase
MNVITGKIGAGKFLFLSMLKALQEVRMQKGLDSLKLRHV